ncbi:hypothetical protein AMS68_000646 [Peltaster fructicola]|uniref:Mitochondrial import receptor subunit Tom22 n=1 Tax=Peltaster fructicola TaxID=286661 RepID=A0A6H0XKG9_9PEZI|nr:hypothetical protein AMS68_000646 [Peltaster fructicola]
MVKLEEVPDEEFLNEQPGPKNDEDDWDTDEEDDDVSDVSEADYDETLADRVAALKDMVPPTYRKHIVNAASTGYSWAARGAAFSGSALWILSTSALLLGVPWALAFSEEQQVQEMEREMRMQQGGAELLTTGTQQAKAAL